MEVVVNDNLSEQIDKLQKITELLEKVKSGVQNIQFLKIKDVSDLTGWSIPTVQKLFNKKDFPACDYGKEKIVEIGAFINYFSVRRCG